MLFRACKRCKNQKALRCNAAINKVGDTWEHKELNSSILAFLQGCHYLLFFHSPKLSLRKIQSYLSKIVRRVTLDPKIYRLLFENHLYFIYVWGSIKILKYRSTTESVLQKKCS